MVDETEVKQLIEMVRALVLSYAIWQV